MAIPLCSAGYRNSEWLNAMPSPDQGALLSVIDKIYEAVERPEIWPQTVYAIGELIGGRRGFWGIEPDVRIASNINRHLLRAGSHSFFLSRKDLEAIDQYVDEFGVLIACLLQNIFLSTLWVQNETAESETIALSITQRYLAALEPLNGPSVSLLSRSTLRKLIAALWEEGCVFGEDNLRCMSLIAPHLDRVLRFQVRLASSDLSTEMMTGALNCLTLGVAFVDRSGRPLWLNERAQEITATSERSRRLAGGGAKRAPASSRALRELIGDAMSRGQRGLLALNREDGMRPLLLTAIPLECRPPADAEQAVCGVVFISDPECTEQPSTEMLRRAFALTYREAQMTMAVAQGHGLRAAAQVMGVAMTTARSQLQQAFAKTGTRHQAELTALVHRTLAGLRPD